MFRKVLSILLAVVMMIGVFSVFPITANAKEVELAETGATRTQVEAVQWIKDRGNEGWWDDVDGVCGCQCVDLIKAYYQYFGYGILSGNAGDYMYDHLPSGSDWYYSDTPIPGSVFVKNYDSSSGYTYGHVGLVYAVDENTMYTVETNLVSPYNGGANAYARFRERSVWFADRFINPTFSNPPQGHIMSESEGAGQTIPDGDYWICSRIAQDYFLDVPGTDYNTKNETNLQMWDMDSDLASKYDVFHVKYLNNNFYRITQYNTNMAIDVAGASLDRGTNVQMYESNGSNAQQWSIEKTEKGYKLHARCNAYYLDVDDCTYSSGTNVKVWEWNDTDAQYFGFIPYSPNERPLSDGVYKIVSALGDSCFLDVSGVPGEFANDSNVQIWNSSNIWSNPDEKFRFEYAGNGYYRVYEATSNLLVEIYNVGWNYLNNNANIKLYEKTNSRGQLWMIKKNSDGTYSFISQLSGYCIDVKDGKTENGTNVTQYPHNGAKVQKWRPIRVLQDDMVTVDDIVITSESMAVDPTVTVEVDNTALKVNTDYTVTTTADIPNRQATVTVTGKGNYCGKVTKTINITLRELQDDDVTVNDVTTTSDAASVDPSVTVEVDGKTLTKNTDYTVEIDADIPNGTGAVTVTGKGNYSGTVTKPFKILINDTTIINDFFGNKYETEKDEIITYYANLTSPIQVNHLNGIIYYNQEVLEPIIASDIGYNVPSFDNGHFQTIGSGQLRFDVYSNAPIQLDNTMIIRMQFRVIKKGGETWLGHQFETPEFTYERGENYDLETHILTDQVLYDPSKAICGDADGDGEVTILDATAIQRKLVEMSVSAFNENAADVDGNGLDITDATWIQRHLAELYVPYPIGEATE